MPGRVRPKVGQLAVALVLTGACAKKAAMSPAPESLDAAAAADREAPASFETLADDLESYERELASIGVGPQAESDAAVADDMSTEAPNGAPEDAKPAATKAEAPRCSRVCDLAEAICDLEGRILRPRRPAPRRGPVCGHVRARRRRLPASQRGLPCVPRVSSGRRQSCSWGWRRATSKPPRRRPRRRRPTTSRQSRRPSTTIAAPSRPRASWSPGPHPPRRSARRPPHRLRRRSRPSPCRSPSPSPTPGLRPAKRNSRPHPRRRHPSRPFSRNGSTESEPDGLAAVVLPLARPTVFQEGRGRALRAGVRPRRGDVRAERPGL